MIPRLLDFAAERSLLVSIHQGAQHEAIRLRRPFCFLSQRPYDPFREHSTAPYVPVRRPYCPECRNKGIVETYDRKEFYCDCEAGREREEMETI